MPLCFVFNIHPVKSAAAPALVVDIIAVHRAVAGLLMAAAVAAETGSVLIRRHDAQTAALWALHLNTEVRAVYALYVK